MSDATEAVEEESFRYQLHRNEFGWQQIPSPALTLVIGKDSIWLVELVDSTTNAVVASSWRADVTATPGVHRPIGRDADVWMPAVVVNAPGWQPLTIGSLKAGPWRDEVPQTTVEYVVADADWPALVHDLGLSPHLTSPHSNAAGISRTDLMRRRRRPGIGLWLIGGAIACLGLLCLYLGASANHSYHVGTPTQVTVTYCTSRGSCNASWTVDGVPKTGQIVSTTRYPVGSSFVGHVHGRNVYAPSAGFLPLVMGGGLTAVAIFMFAISFRRGRRR
jgi:hypothetical protein